MDIETLKKFCAVDSIYEYTLTPWIFDEYACATNQHICIRVPKEGMPLEGFGASRQSNVFRLIEESKSRNLPLFVIPELPASTPCEHCNGTGIAYVCQKCDGDGCTPVNDNNGKVIYYVDCTECDESGQVATGSEENKDACFYCDGRGQKPYQPIKISDAWFDHRYLALIASLPGAMIAPSGPMSKAYFTFNGGDGAVMPMRHEEPAK